jgi:hypothetical protein
MALRSLGPGMDDDQIVRLVNDNFRQLENQLKVQIIRDEQGTNRIIFGRLPDGTYGLVISKDGVDVLSVFN